MSKRKNKVKNATQYVFACDKEKKETPCALEVLMEKHIKECEEAAERTISVPVEQLFPFLR